jgi:hypothetical protein
MLPIDAVIVDVPIVSAEARPSRLEALLMVATVGALLVQVASVRTCVDLSLNVPVATNCCVVPLAMIGAAGVTVIAVNAALVTVNGVLPLTAPKVAVTVTAPTATAVALPVVLTVATPVFEELQLTVDVMSWVK